MPSCAQYVLCRNKQEFVELELADDLPSMPSGEEEGGELVVPSSKVSKSDKDRRGTRVEQLDFVRRTSQERRRASE